MGKTQHETDPEEHLAHPAEDEAIEGLSCSGRKKDSGEGKTFVGRKRKGRGDVQ